MTINDSMTYYSVLIILYSCSLHGFDAVCWMTKGHS